MPGICSTQIALSPNDFSSRVRVLPRPRRMRRARVAWPLPGCQRERKKKKNIKRIKRRCKALLFPDDFIMTPSVQRETPRLLAAAPHADRNFLTINGKCHQRQMTPCALRSAISSRICQSYVLLWFRIRNSSEGSENCSDVSRKWTIPAPGGWKGPRFRSLLRGSGSCCSFYLLTKVLIDLDSWRAGYASTWSLANLCLPGATQNRDWSTINRKHFSFHHQELKTSWCWSAHQLTCLRVLV